MISTRKDLENKLNEMLDCVHPYLSINNTRLNVGNTRTKYSREVQEFEGFARLFWGIAPCLAGNGDVKHLNHFLDGIKHGTTISDAEYWGESCNRSQKLVEMAALACLLILASDKIDNYFDSTEKEQLLRWLEQGIKYDYPQNNWQFFRVLICVALLKNNHSYPTEILNESLDYIESFYIGDGWYQDGKTKQRDYYISFAFHFYSLIYVKTMYKEDPKRCEKWKQRALIFGKDFISFFDREGRAIPFGRSMTYRFAQCAFWSACAFAEVYPYPIGVIKGIVLRNLRWWFQQEIYDKSGILTIGYGYENLVLAEDYNGPGSPYWAFKSLLILALPKDHLFWTVKEESLPKGSLSKALPHAYMLVQSLTNDAIAFSGEQYVSFEPGGVADKYCKFAYSSKYAFNLSRDYYVKERMALDSTLCIEDENGNFILRRKPKLLYLNDYYMVSVWKPYEGTAIYSILIPKEDGHMRIHKVITNKSLTLYDGGFPIIDNDNIKIQNDIDKALLEGDNGFCGIYDLLKNTEIELVKNPPNANLLTPEKTLIPCARIKVNGTKIFGTYIKTENINPYKSIDIELREHSIVVSNQEILFHDQ